MSLRAGPLPRSVQGMLSTPELELLKCRFQFKRLREKPDLAFRIRFPGMPMLQVQGHALIKQPGDEVLS